MFLDEIAITEADLRGINKVVLLACGTSWHAALVGKFLIERFAGLPVEVDYGSEYRYRDFIVDPHTLVVIITQSGETADTLAALREARKKGARSLAICNVVGSMATRESEGTIYTHAGPEIGVASTKAFTSQLVALNLLALFLGQMKGTLRESDARSHLDALVQLPKQMEQALKASGAVEEIVGTVLQSQRFPVSRPRHQLPDRAGRRAETEGNLLHPRRGLSCGRDETWADRADRQRDARRQHCTK